MPFRLEVERLKRVEADLAAARGAAATAHPRLPQGGATALPENVLQFPRKKCEKESERMTLAVVVPLSRH
jgi:hypothetical protein